MNYSKQCELVKAIMENNKSHPTADMVYSVLHETHPNISLATVYRNLNKLASMGVINKICLPNAPDRFDSTTTNHYHMICTNCGEITDCPIELSLDFNETIKTKTEFNVSSYQLVICGVCKNCSK